MTKRKHGIRPPRKPRGENPKVTIANQDRQIRLLIDRCAELENQRRAFEDELRNRRLLEVQHTRLQGWQDCAREVLGLALNSTAPGS